MFSRVSKTIGVLRKLQPSLPRKSLAPIYKPFIRPQLDYAGIVYNQAFNELFHQSLQSLQYSSAITSTIRRTQFEKLYKELGLKTPKSRRFLRKLYLLYKLIKGKSPAYIFQLIPRNSILYTTKSVQKKSNHFLQDKNRL